MKAYELMEKLAKIPAGYEVNIGMTIAKEDLKGNDMVYIQQGAESVNASEEEVVLIR